jgi:hypothetical protein
LSGRATCQPGDPSRARVVAAAGGDRGGAGWACGGRWTRGGANGTGGLLAGRAGRARATWTGGGGFAGDGPDGPECSRGRCAGRPPHPTPPHPFLSLALTLTLARCRSRTPSSSSGFSTRAWGRRVPAGAGPGCLWGRAGEAVGADRQTDRH